MIANTVVLSQKSRSLTRWGGVIMVVQGAAHGFFTTLSVQRFWSDWATGAGWEAGAVDSPTMSQPMAHFWASIGSFAFPLLLLGVLTIVVARRGQVIPVGVTLGYLAWGLPFSAIIAGIPQLATVSLAGLLLLLGNRRSQTA